MIDPAGLQQGKMNAELIGKETQPYLSHDEKKALRQAEKAERAFRAAKGYAPDTFWERLKRKLFRP